MNKNGEPELKTAPELQEVLEQLVHREPIFHRPESGTTRADFEQMTVPDFWKIGAPGRRYSREFVLDILEQRHATDEPDKWETSGFHCRRLSADTYLLTYTLLQDGTRETRRSTIWRQTSDAWQIVFHQGAIVQDGAAG